MAVWRIGKSDVLAGRGYPAGAPSIGAFSATGFEKGAFALIITPAPKISSLINVNANHKRWNTLSRNTNAPVFVYPSGSAKAELFCPACRAGENFIRK